MFKIEWYTANSETCYISKPSRHIISAISTGYTGLLRKEEFVKFVIFDKSNNILFSASKDYSEYSLGVIKKLM